VAKRYEKVAPARFIVEVSDGVEQIRIKARRNWFMIPFLVVWLTLWTLGGAAALFALAAKFDLFLLVWLVGWAGGWLLAAATIAWQLSGAETLRVVGGDLEIGYAFFGFARRRLYRGADISGLAASAGSDIFSRMYSAYPPFLSWGRTGSIKFNYGARMIQAAAGLDEAEGRMIVDHLRRRLPASATEA
jgi:hypothetical protein